MKMIKFFMSFLYPLTSLVYWDKMKDDDLKKKFLCYGSFGTIGIAGFLVLPFIPGIYQTVVFPVSFLFYIYGKKRQKKLISRLVYESQKKKNILLQESVAA